jgi:hypothetical protein
MDEDYIEVPWSGLFGVSDVDFDQMVKMDGKSMQNVCQVNREYAKFCSKDNEEFWASKYAYFAKGLDIPMNWKDRWIHLYKKVHGNPNKYTIKAIKEDKPSILVFLQKCNAEISNNTVKMNMQFMQPRVLDYLLSNVYTSEKMRKKFRMWIEYADDEWEMEFPLDFVKILYKHGIILDRHMFYRKPEIKYFYIQEGVIDVSKIHPRSVKEFRDLKKYGVTWRNMFPYDLEDLFGKCKYEYINELFRDGMTLDDIRNAEPYHDGTPVLTYNLGIMLYRNPGVGKKCANDILSKLRSLGLTKDELNEAYAYAHKLRAIDEEEAVEAAEEVAELALEEANQALIANAVQELEDQEGDEIEIGGDPDDLGHAEGQNLDEHDNDEDEY